MGHTASPLHQALVQTADRKITNTLTETIRVHVGFCISGLPQHWCHSCRSGTLPR